MDKTYRKLALLLCACLGLSLAVMSGNLGLWPGRRPGRTARAAVTLLEEPAQGALSCTGDTCLRALLLYSPGDAASVRYESDLRRVLEPLRIRADSLALARTGAVQYTDYDLVILATARWEEMPEPAARLLRYVANGGRLLVGALPESPGPGFAQSARSLGIAGTGGGLPCDAVGFCGEVLPGIRDKTFAGAGLADGMLSLTLEEGAVVYAWGRDAAGQQSPLIWRYDCGQGRVVVLNGTAGRGDIRRGLAAGCVNLLFDTTLYPVVNALCLFVEDFSTHPYDSAAVRQEYNCSVGAFCRDIWWPAMLRAAGTYGDLYIGLTPSGGSSGLPGLPDLQARPGAADLSDGEAFRVHGDGTVEFPRITAGMDPDDREKLAAYGGVGLYGVVSHDLGPGGFGQEQGETWEQRYRSYCDWRGQVHETWPFLRVLNAAEAADAVRIAASARPHLEIRAGVIRGSIENFCGETCFCLRTDRTPRSEDDNCTIRRISAGKGEGYYLLTVKSPNFTVKLV